MKRTFRTIAVPVALAAAVATLAGCQVPSVTPGQANNIIQQAAAYASLGLKMLDDAGIETGIDRSQISKLMVAGKEVVATYDADGNLQVPVAEGGGEQLVEVVLTDGQKIQMPVKGKKGDKFDAYLMSGYNEGELIAEVGARGAKPMDIFKDKTVLFKIGDPAITPQSVKAFYIASFKSPRQSWFVEGNDLRLHASNLWVLMHAQGGPGQRQGQAPQGGQQPMQPQGGMQPPPGGMQPPPGGTQPPPGGTQPPMFTIAQAPPPPGGATPPPPPPGGGTQPPPPGGTQPPPPGASQPPVMGPGPTNMQPQQPAGGQQAGAQKAVLRVAAEVGGKIKVWAFTAKPDTRLPGPPPAPEPGKPPMFKDLPTIDAKDFTVESKEFASLEELEAAIGKKAGNFMPPPPPPRQGGTQPPPPPPGGTQPQPPR